ncbi:MAG: hypothetical protein KME29_37685 [Calothrix sp. FI2-JRJ7]|jgi:glycosyltransferase involved in cell wall biosynthesis|nr:hypothetical protein [Calothrix sp. FI2-JRJ7]
MNKSCSIFFYEGWLSAAPTVINLATILANIGYQVIIYTRINRDYSLRCDLGKDITVVYLEKPSFIASISRTLKEIQLGGTASDLLDLIAFAIQILLWNLKHKGYLNRHVSIGIDTNGSIIAWIESMLLKSQLVYLSLELTIGHQFKKFDKARLFLERLAFKKSCCVLIQDEDRFEYLCSQNEYKHHQVFYLPNTVTFSKSVDEEPNQNYFREVLQLNQEDYPYLVTHAGMICDAVFSKELANVFNQVNSGCALIYHDARQRSLDEPYIQLLKDINSTNLFLSLNPLPYEEVYKIFNAATIGVALYKGIDENFANIAKASGKLSAYLQYGKPVIMSNLKSLVELNTKYEFGKIIQDISCPKEINTALKDILSNYEIYSKNARVCFEQEFMLDTKVEPFLKFINAG